MSYLTCVIVKKGQIAWLGFFHKVNRYTFFGLL